MSCQDSIKPVWQGLAAPALEKSSNPHVVHYLESQLPAHRQVLAIFQAKAAKGSEARLIAFVKQTIPVTESHNAMHTRDIAALGSGAMSMPEQK